jgi:hypothetical protein
MSCIPSISTKLTTAQLREADQQKLKFTSPPWRYSKVLRLQLLASNDNPKIRERVALDYMIPVELQRSLAQDPDSGVRACLARNKNISWEVLRILAKDAEEVVRGHVVLNYSCPEELITAAAEDSSELVRRLVYLVTRVSKSVDTKVKTL